MLLRFYFLLSREKKGRARGKKKDKEATQNRRIIKRKRERERRRRRKKNGVFQRTRAAWRDEGDTERDSDTHKRVTSLERYAKKKKAVSYFSFDSV